MAGLPSAVGRDRDPGLSEPPAAFRASVAAALPRHVLLFSGHRIDAIGRHPPRLPAHRSAAAGRAIDAALHDLAAGPGDLALTQGSSGGDLLFAHACLARGVPLHFLQPHPEPRFIEESVRASEEGDAWVQRYAAVRARLASGPHALPPPAPAPATAWAGDDPFVRCNRWLLASALSWGAARLRLIALWDGATDGGPGGTADMVAAVQRLGLGWVWLDARQL